MPLALPWVVSALMARVSSAPSKHHLTHALASGILFLDDALENRAIGRDGLGQDAAKTYSTPSWAQHGHAIDERSDLRDYLRMKFFEDVHLKMYESRPIYWPLSSEKKTFVALATIHRWNEGKAPGAPRRPPGRVAEAIGRRD